MPLNQVGTKSPPAGTLAKIRQLVAGSWKRSVTVTTAIAVVGITDQFYNEKRFSELAAGTKWILANGGPVFAALAAILGLAVCVLYRRLQRTNHPKVRRGRWEDVKQLTYGHVDYVPFLSYPPGGAEPVGFGLELLHLLLEGTQIKLCPYHTRSNWSDVIADLRDGRFDLVATPLFQTQERASAVSFTAPLFFCDIGLYVNRQFAERRHLRGLPLREIADDLVNLGKPMSFYYVEGEISQKLALKYHGKARLVSKHKGEHIISSSLNELNNATDGEGAFMFSEVVHAQRADRVRSGDVVNILPERGLLYPVAFAVRKGDYILQNLLNMLLLQVDGRQKVLELLATQLKSYGMTDVNRFYVTEWNPKPTAVVSIVGGTQAG